MEVASTPTVVARGVGGRGGPGPRPRPRLDFLDNLKVALVILVVLHHAAQPYGPPDWWYVPGGRRATVLESFTVVNGSFFMALFFAISAYVMPGAYDRKGGRAFVLGRLKRLGIPFVVGALTVVPALTYVYYRVGRDYPPVSFPRYYLDTYLGFGGEPDDWTGPTWPDLQFGHLWFIQHLLIYGLLYALWRLLTRSRRPRPPTERAPGSWGILAVAVVIGAATAAIRVAYPVDRWEAVLEFIQVEIADVAQYAGLFLLGLVAYRRGWLTGIDRRTGYAWLGVGVVLAVGYYAGHDWLVPHFAGGGANLAQLTWSGYESLMCVSLCVGLVVLFRERVDRSSAFSRALAAASFTVYLIHVPVVVGLQLAVRPLGLPPLVAFTVVGVVGVIASFVVAHHLRRLPGLCGVL